MDYLFWASVMNLFIWIVLFYKTWANEFNSYVAYYLELIGLRNLIPKDLSN
jgi:hypothetical protein